MRRRLLICLLLLLPLPAWAAPAFKNKSTMQTDANPHIDQTITLPAHAAGDVLLLVGVNNDQDETMTVSGWTALSGSPFDLGSVRPSRVWIFWLRATSSSETNPLMNFSGTTADVYGMVYNYSGAIDTGTPWEVVGSTATGTADPATLTGITTLTAGSLVVPILFGQDNNNASCDMTGTDPSTYTEQYDETAIGLDCMYCVGDALRSAAGATGSVSVDFNVANPVEWVGLVLALKPPAASARRIMVVD